VEYWGLDTAEYKMGMYKKQILYQQEGKRLVSVYPKDLPALDQLLSVKLRFFGYSLESSAREAKPDESTRSSGTRDSRRFQAE
jgi:hypothetical protein